MGSSLASTRGLTRWAFGLSAAGVLVGCAIGYHAYVASRNTLLDLIYESNQKLARVLALYADNLHGTRSDEEVVASLEQMWKVYAGSYPGSHLCVIDGHGAVALDSVDPAMAGRDVAHLEIRPGTGKTAATVAQLLGVGADAVGVCSVTGDPDQVGAFAYSKGLDGLISVFVPGSVVAQRIRTTAVPWAAGMGILSLFMMPSALLLLYRAFLSTRSRLQAANARLQGEVRVRQEAERRVRDALKEREVLLQEVYHRVKNNLQIVSSLLTRQAAATDDPRAAGVLRDSRNRVHAMALIHQQLYQSSDLAHIQARQYLNRLTTALFQSHGAESQRLALRQEVEDVPLALQTAIPVGLIVNELVTNAIQHAFPDGRRGEIRILLARQVNGDCQLVVADDGGVCEAAALDRPGSLGLRVVADLARQLEGPLEIECRGGTEFRLTFPMAGRRDSNDGGNG